MTIGKLQKYIVLTGLGFIAAMGTLAFFISININSIPVWNILNISLLIMIVLFVYQIWISNTLVVIPVRDAEAEERTRIMLEATPMICTLWDAKGNLIDCNGDILKRYGFSKKSDYLEHFYELIPEYQPNGESSRSVITRLAETALKTGYERLDWMSRTPAGAELPVEITIVRVAWKNSYRFVVFARDLSVFKSHADRALAAELKYHKAKSDFLSRVSHELRTPLNTIMGILNVSGKTVAGKEHDTCCEKIRDASENLLSLVNNIIDTTSLDTGMFYFSPKPFNFKAALNSVIETTAKKARGKNQAFTTNIDQRIGERLISDEQRVKQVLLSLLSNAVKFTPEGGAIELAVRELSNDGNECAIRFEITDTGIGIEANTMERLWELFEQADNSITRKYGGLGLGLPLTKHLVEMMNGSISVESEQGKGSRFTCEIRLGIAKEEAKKEIDDKSAEISGSADSDFSDLTGKKILIVDDVDINREILIAMLEGTGAVLHEAATGDEAVRMFRDEQYHFVFMDLHMPVMDGFEAAAKIRNSGLPWARSIPIISVSADSGKEVCLKCIEAGINDYLSKPLKMETLNGVLKKWAERAVA